MNCPHCSSPNADDARFCGVCGRATSSTEPVSNPNLGAAPTLVGREIAGRYRIHSKLGEGGMGAVYRAEQISLKRTVAVKLLRPEVASSPLLLRRFNAEAEAVAKLSHPNTVNIYDFGQDTDGTLFIAMEFIEGRSLRAVIQAEAPFPLRRALSIASQVAASLTDAHMHNIVHRDLKPDNVMLQDRGRTRDVVRVLDFGIAKLRDEGRATQMQMTQAGDMLGTPQYMAPEQIRAETIDGRTDVYALGCMLYEMMTARLPYEALTVLALLSKHLIEKPVPPSQRRPDLIIAPAVDQLILSAMAKDPAERPATMEQFGEEIAAMLATLPPETMPHSAVMGAQPSRVQQVVPPPSFAPHTPGATLYTPPASPSPHARPHAGAPYSPQATPATPMPVHAPSPAPARSSAAKWIVLGVLAVGGGGVGVWAAMRSKAAEKPGPVEPPPPPPHVDDPPPPPHVDEPPPPPHVDDPWTANGANGTTSAPLTTVLPAGSRLIAPPDFELTTNTPQGQVIVDKAHGVVIALAPMATMNDDPEAISNEWASSMKLHYDGLTKITSHGAERWVAHFTGQGPNGPIAEILIGYTTSKYRLGLLVAAPPAMLGQPKFLEWLAQFLEGNVIIP